jgi:hypothetical protein
MTSPLSRAHESHCDPNHRWPDLEEPCRGRAAPHTCPYLAEIHEDTKTRCTCCDACTKRCTEEI